MIIKQLNLCPFAGFPQRKIDFQMGMNVILGENEAGKSTIARALKCVLFETTTLSKVQLAKFADNFFPKGKSDQARVMLKFQQKGIDYELEKVWGAGKSAKLSGSDGSIINDETAVQTKLNELLELQRGSWETILFADQSKMAQTMETLQSNTIEINRIPTFQKSGTGIPGDIPSDDLLQLIQAQIQNYTSQWDLQSNGPKDGRGITNQWKVKVGKILKSYYELETVKSEYQNLITLELESDQLMQSILAIDAEMIPNKNWITQNKEKKEIAKLQKSILSETEKLETQLGPMKVALGEWPTLTGQQPMLELAIKEAEVSINRLNKEYKNAELRMRGEPKIRAQQIVEKCTQDGEEIKEQLKKIKSISGEEYKSMQTLLTNLNNAKIELQAQKLKGNILSKSAKTIRIKSGMSDEKSLDLSPNILVDFEASGKIQMRFEDLEITLESALKPVGEIIRSIKQFQKSVDNFLAQFGLSDLTQFESVYAQSKILFEKLVQKRQEASQAIVGISNSFEELFKEYQALIALPQTREFTEITEIIGEENKKMIEKQNAFEQNQSKIKIWDQQYGDVQKLAVNFAIENSKYEQLKLELINLESIPAGFITWDDFLNALELAEKRNYLWIDERNAFTIELTRAKTQLENFQNDAQSLKLILENLQDRYNRCTVEHNALVMAESKLLEIINANPENPFESFELETATLFAQLTSNQYSSLVREGESPIAVISQNIEIPTRLLSGGTAASLALAIRIAYAKLYLKNMDGFFLLDDPFTEMDDDRRNLACQVLNQFATEKQVLFFTCHPFHAQKFNKTVISLSKNCS